MNVVGAWARCTRPQPVPITPAPPLRGHAPENRQSCSSTRSGVSENRLKASSAFGDERRVCAPVVRDSAGADGDRPGSGASPGQIVEIQSVPVDLSRFGRKVPGCGVLGVSKTDRETPEVNDRVHSALPNQEVGGLEVAVKPHAGSGRLRQSERGSPQLFQSLDIELGPHHGSAIVKTPADPLVTCLQAAPAIPAEVIRASRSHQGEDTFGYRDLTENARLSGQRSPRSL